MKVRLIAVLAAVCLLTAGAWASPMIDVGVIEAQPGTTKTFSISVTGGGAVQGLDLYIQIGDGGAANNGSGTKPIITNVDIIGLGTMFNASNSGQTNTWASDLLWAVSTTTDTSKTNYLDASGVIAYVTINTAGTAMGESYPLRLSGVATGIFGSPGVDTAFAGVPAAITNGRIGIVSEPAPVAGDANLDGVVDAADYIILKQNFGMTGAQWLDGDFCGDHQVNWTDLQILMTNFGTRSGTTPATTPEPATLGLLALGGLALLRRKSSDSQSRLDPYVYENRSGLPASAFADSPATHPDGRYSLKVDDGIYLWSISEKGPAGELAVLEARKSIRQVAGWVMIALSVVILLWWTFRVYPGPRFAGWLAMLISPPAGAMTNGGYICYAMTPLFRRRDPATNAAQQELLAKYRDAGVISDAMYGQALEAANPTPPASPAATQPATSPATNPATQPGEGR